jgi:transcriptional regulator with XRE-family HTH domain
MTGKQSLRALGEALRAARLERGYSQERFATAAGLDRSYYGTIERGESNITLITSTKVAAGLGLSLSDLCKRAGL